MTTTTTSPIVSLAWTLARIVAHAPSQAALGYPYRLRAQSLTVTRANGTVEERTADAVHGEVQQALKASHRTAILSAIAARVAAAVEAEPKDKDGVKPERLTAIIKEQSAAFYAEGTITFPVEARASRTVTLDDTDDIAAMLAAQAEG